jgi:hypothetical protein
VALQGFLQNVARCEPSVALIVRSLSMALKAEPGEGDGMAKLAMSQS